MFTLHLSQGVKWGGRRMWWKIFSHDRERTIDPEGRRHCASYSGKLTTRSKINCCGTSIRNTQRTTSALRFLSYLYQLHLYHYHHHITVLGTECKAFPLSFISTPICKIISLRQSLSVFLRLVLNLQCFCLWLPQC